MPTPRKDQKQIAQRYAANLRYFRNLHPFRRARMLLTLACLIMGVVVAAIYLSREPSSRRLEALGTSGGISQAHSRFAQDCKQCHDVTRSVDPLKPSSVEASTIDAKCEVCHVQHTFHQADVVAGHSCVDCHHEHLGTG